MFDYLQKIIIGLVAIALTIAFFFGFFTIITSITSARDKKLWNGGHCDVCGGAWEYEQAIGHRSSTSYIYVCDGCGKRIEISEVR